MANPWIDGSSQSNLYSVKNCSVERELIEISLIQPKEKGEERFVHFKVTYHIISDADKIVPLVFVASNFNGNSSLKVNDFIVKQQEINPQNENFLVENLNDLKIKFDEYDEYAVELKNLIYFKANLNKGKNLIIVEYDADLAFDITHFERNYTLEYALYPSKYWKSFGNIEVRFSPAENIEILSSNIGDFKKTDKQYIWNFNQTDKDLKIEFSPKYSLFEKFLMAFQPMGIAILFLIPLTIFHLRLIKNRRKNHPKKFNWWVILGIILVTTIFFSVWVFAYDFIDFVLKQRTRRGYILLGIMILLPFFLLFYSLSVSLYDKNLKRKLIQ